LKLFQYWQNRIRIPTPALIGIDWAFDNEAILNMKQQWMSFEKELELHSCSTIGSNSQRMVCGTGDKSFVQSKNLGDIPQGRPMQLISF